MPKTEYFKLYTRENKILSQLRKLLDRLSSVNNSESDRKKAGTSEAVELLSAGGNNQAGSKSGKRNETILLL